MSAAQFAVELEQKITKVLMNNWEDKHWKKVGGARLKGDDFKNNQINIIIMIIILIVVLTCCQSFEDNFVTNTVLGTVANPRPKTPGVIVAKSDLGMNWIIPGGFNPFIDRLFFIHHKRKKAYPSAVAVESFPWHQRNTALD